MKYFRLTCSIIIWLALLTACATTVSTTAPVPTQVVENSTSTPSSISISPKIYDFPAATSLALATAGDTVYMITGDEHSLYVSRSTDGGQTFSEPVSAIGDQMAHVLRVERPAIAANEQGEVGVAWLELDVSGGNNKVWYASSTDNGETFGAAQLVSEETPGELAMVSAVLDSDGNPFLSWLSVNDLRFARSTDGGATFSPAKTIGDGACECCQPDMLVKGEALLIGYRGLGEDEEGQFRDAALIRSLDGGRTFEPVTLATDSHWYINACPISGPSIEMANGSIYITWMDGRAVAPDNLLSSDVWFAASSDEGKTFSTNLKLSDGSSTHNFLPVMAVGPGGRIHLAWQAISADAIYYAISDDGGQTFSAPYVIADSSSSDRGRPAGPSLVIDSKGRVYLAWLDDAGVRLAVWEDFK